MKVIISHDVDHLTAWEHLQDGILLKFLLRHSFEFISGSVTLSNFKSIGGELLQNRWEHLDEIMQFDRAHQVPATYFVGVANGMGLSYSKQNAHRCIQRIREGGFEVGTHGICFDDPQGIQEEHDRFQSFSGLSNFGIRLHYLRMAETTLDHLAQAGYSYECSVYGLKGPFRLHNLIEFPLQLMDVRVFYQTQNFKTVPLKQAQEFTLKVIDQTASTGLPYLSIMFHDRYFCSTYGKWRDWYIWLIEYLQDQGFGWVNYQYARQEIINNL